MLRYCDDFETHLKKKDPVSFVKSFYLTNTVMHSRASEAGHPTRRMRFWGNSYSSCGETPLLKLLSNDDTSGANFRIDTNSGRFLSFTKHGNHIRAGRSTPADSALSLYQYFYEILSDNKHGGAMIDMVSIPNLVGTGEFHEKLNQHSFETNGLVSKSNKFPGCAVSLSTGCTPVVYPGKDFENKTWILPGITSVEQTFESLNALHEITHHREECESADKELNFSYSQLEDMTGTMH